MNARLLALRSLRHYRRTNLAVIAGVACAVAVLAGALLVGDSVRGSLRAIAGARLGNADVISRRNVFPRTLAEALAQHPHQHQHQHRAQPIFLPAPFRRASVRMRRRSRYGVDTASAPFTGRAVAIGVRPRGSQAIASESVSPMGICVIAWRARPHPLESLHGRE